MEQNNLLSSEPQPVESSGVVGYENGANSYVTGVCDNILTPDEEAAMKELESEYQLQRAEEQRIIKAELDRIYREELRQKFEHYILSAYDSIPPVTPIVKRFDKVICSEGNISAVVGEAKSKKTFLCTAIVASLIDHLKRQMFGIESTMCKVLWIDTEQSRAHIQRVLWRINNMCSLPHNVPHPKINLLALREESPVRRLDLMKSAIEYYQPRLVVVDGVSDLMDNINNLESSEALVSSLLTLSSVFKCHIMCVLHANPNSDKARGHLGSTLMRKVESIMYVHKVGDVSFVEPHNCRNEEFERFAFKIEPAHDAEFLPEECMGLGIPVECDPQEYESAKKENDCVRILREVFGGVAERQQLTNKLMESLNISIGNARVKITRAIQCGLVSDNEGMISCMQQQ
jgi:hypothetical protein